MNPFEIIIGILIIVLAVVLTALVMMQSGKDKKLSGAIAGGSDSFLSKNKSGKTDAMLTKLTAILSIVFAVLVIVMYIMVS